MFRVFFLSISDNIFYHMQKNVHILYVKQSQNTVKLLRSVGLMPFFINIIHIHNTKQIKLSHRTEEHTEKISSNKKNKYKKVQTNILKFS